MGAPSGGRAACRDARECARKVEARTGTTAHTVSREPVRAAALTRPPAHQRALARLWLLVDLNPRADLLVDEREQSDGRNPSLHGDTRLRRQPRRVGRPRAARETRHTPEGLSRTCSVLLVRSFVRA